MTTRRAVYKHPTGWVTLDTGEVVTPGTDGQQTPDPGNPVTPTEPATAVLFGGSYGTKPGIDNDIYQGRSMVSRHYWAGASVGGINGGANAEVKRSLAAGAKALVVSFHDADPTRVKTFLNTFPKTVKLYACYKHEPENDANLTPAQWRQSWVQVSPGIRAAGAIPTSILMAYTLTAANRNPEDWILPPGTIDVFGFDGYFNNFDPPDFYARAATLLKKHNITRMGIAETGSTVGNATRNARAISMRQGALDFYKNYGITLEYACIWNSYDTNATGGIILDTRMLKSSYFAGNPQTKRAPTPADWDNVYADNWFGPVG